MSKHKKSKKQNIYKMKGCSNKKTRRNKKYLGGSGDVPLGYPSTNVPTVSNPNLAYDPSHSSNQPFFNSSSNSSVDSASNPGTNVARAYPSPGPISTGFNFLNPQVGSGRHRKQCRCSVCKSKNMSGGCGCGNNQPMLGGGSSISNSNTSNNGLPYPNGLLGEAWTPNVKGWPGVDGISMNRNHLGYNTYSTDVSRQMLDVGANPPFTYMKGGRTKKNKKHRKNLKGGTLSNFLAQDFVNLGRQFKFNTGSTWNALRGYEQPINPMPWKDQLRR